MDDQHKQRPGHAVAIFLAVLLYLLGDKSLVLAKLAISAYDGLVKDKAPNSTFVYEASLVGLLIGTCAVIVISYVWKKQLGKDNLAILIGLVTASIAAILNIADAAVFCGMENCGDIPWRALFFYVLFVFLFLIPLFTRIAGKRRTEGLDLDVLVLTCLALVIAFIVGFGARNAASGIVLATIDRESIASLNAALDWLRFNSDSLIVLGSVWSVATYAPFAPNSSRPWSTSYILMAPVAGYLYARLLAYPEGDPSFSVSANRMAFGFAILSLAAILPAARFAPAVFAQRYRQVLPWAGTTFLLSTIGMLAGLSGTLDLGFSERLLVSVVQGGSAMLIPPSVAMSVWILSRLRTGLAQFCTGISIDAHFEVQGIRLGMFNTIWNSAW